MVEPVTWFKENNSERILMGRLHRGDDLLETLLKLLSDEKISAGSISAIGAVEKAMVSYYDQEKRIYIPEEILKPMEILNLSGNISLKENQPLLHAHITLSDYKGTVYGGHLLQGTTVFACEFTLTVFNSTQYNRELDQATGLPLWKTD